jgi:hypothetical protein
MLSRLLALLLLSFAVPVVTREATSRDLELSLETVHEGAA